MQSTNEFLYASELKSDFKVSGFFYSLDLNGEKFNCRSVLDIKRLKITESLIYPDAVIFMMNPGSSKPCNKNEVTVFDSQNQFLNSSVKNQIEAHPDYAQYQIMRLMKIKHWNFVRILNLSDIREGNSGSFQKLFYQANEREPNNILSISHPSRSEELAEYVTNSDEVVKIAAWGNLCELVQFAQEIIKKFPDIIAVGTYAEQKIKTNPNVKHISPYRKEAKIKIIKELIEIIDSRKSF